MCGALLQSRSDRVLKKRKEQVRGHVTVSSVLSAHLGPGDRAPSGTSGLFSW